MASTESKRRASRRVAREIDARRQIARQDLATAFATIFSPRPRADERKAKVTVSGFFAGVRITIKTMELSATDLAVLLALECLAGEQGQVTEPSKAPGLIEDSPTQPNALLDAACLRVETTEGSIAKLIGRRGADGRARAMIRESLENLMQVLMVAERGDEWGATHLISAARGRGGKVSVVLNYRATQAVLGKGQWAAIDMRRLAAASAVERVVMHRLAAHCTGRQPFPITLTHLAELCWVRKPSGPRVARQRVEKVRAAVPKALPPGIRAVIGGGKVTFQRV